jgi:hypothetical protein
VLRTTREQDGRPGVCQGLVVVHSDKDVDDETITVGGVNKNNFEPRSESKSLAGKLTACEASHHFQKTFCSDSRGCSQPSRHLKISSHQISIGVLYFLVGMKIANPGTF